MTFAAIFLMALALAMDAFAVALATGMKLRCIQVAHVGRMAGAFGLFQFAMPVIGWALGIHVQEYIESIDHWIAFGLLSFVGIRMLKEAWDNRGKGAECCEGEDPTSGTTLLLLGLATSIDALAVGLSMAILQQDIMLPAVIIGLVCFCVTAVGMYLGRWACSLAGLSNKANAMGGLVLVGIGIGILREHGVFAI